MSTAGHPRPRLSTSTQAVAASPMDVAASQPDFATSNLDDHTLYGSLPLDDPGLEVDATERLEVRFLASLIWAPTPLAAQVIAALIGTPQQRDQDGTHAEPPVAHLPATAPLLWQPVCQLLFATIVELVDEGSPLCPELVDARLGSRGQRRRALNVLLNTVSPREHSALPGSRDLPYLAAALVDGWYRRGFRTLAVRAAQIADTAEVDTLAGHLADLTSHQQRAERRRLSIRDALARL